MSIHFQTKVVLSICLLEKSCVGLAISRHSPPTSLTGGGIGFFRIKDGSWNAEKIAGPRADHYKWIYISGPEG